MEDDYSVDILKLGFKPQKKNINNKLLPNVDEVHKEALKEFKLIKSNLIKCILAHELKPGFHLWSSRLDDYLSLYGLMFSKEDHISLIKLYLEVLKIETDEAMLVAKWSSILVALLKKKYLISREELEIDWKPFYNLYLRAKDNTKSEVGMFKDRALLEQSAVNAAKAARTYFSASATQEILDVCKPHLCMFSELDMINYLAIMETLLPVNVKVEEAHISYNLWFTEMMELWNSCLNESSWEDIMLSLMTRLCSNNVGYIDFEPYIPIMYLRFTRAFQLPVNYKLRISSKTHLMDISSIALWIVSTLNHKTETSFYHLERFMNMIKSFLYSANVGRWTIKLKELFNKLSSHFVRRIYCERYKPKSWEKEVPDDFKLNDSDIDRFVLILKPCLELAMFSRRISSDLNSTFQSLAALRPNLIIPMTLEKLYLSLDSVTEPHRLISAMSAVISVSRFMVDGAKYNYPEGPTHVIPLLIAVLPGIDPNDFRKCIVTFEFISQIISMVPIINSSEAYNYYDLTEEEHIICEATAGFEDFIMRLIDVLCVWLESSSLAFPSSYQSAENHVRGGTEFLSEHAMSSAVCTILRQCSPEIFTAALKKVFKFVTNNVFEVAIAGRLVAFLCNSFSKVNPKETLNLFIPYLCNKIESLLNEIPNAQIEEHLDEEILYNMMILSEVVDGKNEILFYLKDIIHILNRTVHLTCLMATKISIRLLTLIMTTLTVRVPMEKKSIDKSYSSHVKDFLPIREWGRAYHIQELQVEWYIPSDAEIEAVKLLINIYLVPEIEKMNKYSNGEICLTRTELRNSLKIINAFMSANTVLPMWQETPIELYESVAPLEYYQAIETKVYSVTMPDGSNVRKTIVNTLHKVQQKLLEIDEGDTMSFFVLSNLYNGLLSNRHALIDCRQNLKNISLIKKISCNCPLERKKYFRHIMIDRATIQQFIRKEETSYPITNTHKQILFNLFELGISRYRDVRAHAQNKLMNFLNDYQYAYVLFTEKIKEILKMNVEENHEKFKGCLYILWGSKSHTMMVKPDWKFLKEIWPLLVTSRPSEKPSIINLITHLSETVSLNIQTTDMVIDVPESQLKNVMEIFETTDVCKNFSQDKSIEYSKQLKRIAEDNINNYNDCISSLLNACNDNNIHWRYHLLAMGFLRDMVHMGIKYNPAVIKYFLKSLINESILIRKIALKVVLFIMIQNKLKFKKINIDPLMFSDEKEIMVVPGHRKDNEWLLYNSENLPKNQKEWNELKYFHDTSLGYYSWPKTIQMYSSPEDQVQVKLDEMTNEEREIFNFFTDEQCLSKVIYYFSLEDKKGKDQFNPAKLLLFNYLAKLYGDKILDIFLPHLEKLVIKDQESYQRCAAEIIAGLVRGSKHWTYNKVEKLWFNVIPILQEATQKISTETLQDWTLCITTCLEGRDSRRCHWLIEYLLDDPLSDPTSLIASTKLQFAIIAINQQPWRNCELYQRLLEYLKTHLNHPFQIIRNKISSTLKLIFSKDYLPPGGLLDRNPKVSEFLDGCMPTFNWLYEDTLKKIDNNRISCDISSSETETKKEEALRLFKIVCKFIVSELVCRQNLNTPMDFYKLLPLTFVLQNNEIDDEIQPMCNNLLAILALTIVDPKNVPGIFQILDLVLTCTLWSARSILAEFLSTFVFHNMSVLSSNNDWIEKVQVFVMTLLEDSQPEVRENACKLLSGLLHCKFLPCPSKLLMNFKIKARTKLKKYKKETHASVGIGIDNLIIRHAGVLGLCAFINSTPYDVPEFIPDIFGVLGPHLSDPQPIPSTIRKTLCDFKRTHQDNWEVHKMCFTDEQLVVLRDLTVPPSYYV